MYKCPLSHKGLLCARVRPVILRAAKFLLMYIHVLYFFDSLESMDIKEQSNFRCLRTFLLILG